MNQYAMTKTAVPEHVLCVCKTLEGAGHEAWVVGGCVRDFFLGRKPKDWDVATSARPQEVTPLFRRVEPTGIEHGTVSVIHPGGYVFDASGEPIPPVEVTTFRGDGEYSDGRRPDSVVFLNDIKEDLARRDFTINAMAYRPMKGAFADPFMGRLDIKAKRIKAVGTAYDRFNEDGLRPMRACRFAAQLGFRVEEKTAEAMTYPDVNHKFRMVAVERITAEFEKLIVAPNAASGLSAMLAGGMLCDLFPHFMTPHGAIKKGAFETIETLPPELTLRLAALLFAEPEAVARLRFPRDVEKGVHTLVHGVKSVPASPTEGNEAAVRRWVAGVGKEHYKAVLTLAEAVLGVPLAVRVFSGRVEAAMAQKPALTLKELRLSGEEVQEVLGCGPGKTVGLALRYLLDRVLEEPALNKPHLLTKVLLTEWCVTNESGLGWFHGR